MLPALREALTERLIGFAWDQWSQMGLSVAPPRAIERRAADPEALILFTLEVGRREPRLFDELLDWLAHNHGLVSTQRLRNLCVAQEDGRLAASVLNWLDTRSRPLVAASDPEPLFPAAPDVTGELDPAFAAAGFRRPLVHRSRKSSRPQLDAPINLAFRLRSVFGRDARAEILRVLLTTDAPRVPVGVLSAAAGFADRNVREALAKLTAAGAIEVGGVRDYRMDWSQWQAAVPPTRPAHYDWIQGLHAARELLRWLHDPAQAERSDYLLASEARQLVARLEPDLRFAGIPVFGQTTRGAAYWEEFEQTAHRLVTALSGLRAAGAHDTPTRSK